MSGFEQYEQSVEDGAPIDLYVFKYGDPEQYYLYTNSDFDVPTDNNRIFRAIAIQRQTFKTNGDFSKTNMVIEMPITTDIANLFLPYPPPGIVGFDLYQRHQDDPAGETLLVFSGKVTNVQRSGVSAKLTVENAIIPFKRPGLNRLFQHQCPLKLYQQGLGQCNADRNNFRVAFQIQDVQPDGVLVFPPNWYAPFQPDNFVAGTLRWHSTLGYESRTIHTVGPEGASFHGFTRDIFKDTPVEMFCGCRHNRDNCLNLFNNINNYGGQPWIPLEVPKSNLGDW